MERELMKKLMAWKDSPRRKPLILKGARQVGKTWLMQQFGKRCYKQTAYVNFDNNPAMQQVFRQDFDINRILLAINAWTGVRVLPKETLLIFDEVQEAPLAISALKYFYENAPEYSVIAAGSLLGTALHKGISYPVGKVSTVQLHPLSFYEFLNAIGEEGLAELLDNGDELTLKAFHDRFVTALKNYYVVGGMPEAVDVFVKTRDFAEVRQVQKALLDLYEADFGKHIPDVDLPRVRLIWNAIPSQLAKDNRKFFFGQVKKGARASEFEKATKWLVDCGLIIRVHRIAKPAVPMAANVEQNAYKLFFVDVGLLGAVSELDVRSIIEGNRLFVEYKGALTEQYVCQELQADKASHLYYFTSENGHYEIDFMIQQGNDVIPVEVKAEQNLRSKSLRAYFDKYHPHKTIRLSIQDYRKQDWVENIPLFAIHTFM
ncbi:MAG: ATP-binding protein [Desulfovibrio sp.]|nr:ATP-binding protein [Desulfovibrio sp.]